MISSSFSPAGALANTKLGRNSSGTHHRYSGKECLDIHCFKSSRVWADVAAEHASGSQQVIGNTAPDDQPAGELIAYLYRAAHPILRWLPTKFAEWIGDNY